MIRRHDAAARARGARIVFSCGFDSVPFDLGVLALQRLALSRTGRPLTEVQSRVLVMKGGFSGGTAASLLATLEAVARDPQAARDMADPFALVPGFRGPPQPAPAAATHDDFLGQWSAPFVMAPINTKNVHRTHALLGHPWGDGFVYGERMACGDGTEGELRARAPGPGRQARRPAHARCGAGAGRPACALAAGRAAFRAPAARRCPSGLNRLWAPPRETAEASHQQVRCTGLQVRTGVRRSEARPLVVGAGLLRR